MNEQYRDVRISPGDVIFSEGDTVYVADAELRANAYANMPPVARAVIVARLRAVADIVEQGGLAE